MLLTSYNWPSFAKNICDPSSPEEYCEAATERFMNSIHQHIVDVKNVRYQFNGINKIKLIDFESQESYNRYQKAYIAYLEAMGKMEDKSSFARLVEEMKFQQAAELERADWLARNMVNGVKEGYAAVCAAKYKATIAKVTLLLCQKHGIPRDKISLIWGGDKVYAGTKDFYKPEEITALIMRAVGGEKLDTKVLKEVRKQLLATQAGLGELPSELRLNVQSAEDRQREIIRFQNGKADFCLYSFKSGGVGLSLHHTDEQTKEKVRRKKESNYAVEEDISLIPTKPRLSFVAPTYSAIELVQALGRCPRITSLSDTLQTLVFFRGTVEENVAAIVSTKLKCLKKVVRKKESWEDCIYTYSTTPPESRNWNVVDEEKIEMETGISDIEEEDEDE